MKRPMRRQRTNLRVLSAEQRDELMEGFGLLLGRPSAFGSDEEIREAWALHGERLMADWEVPFRRPRGWWLARGEEPPETAQDEAVRLIDADELTAAERKRPG